MASSIYLSSDNLVLIEEVTDALGLLTDAEILAATGSVTLYSDAAHTLPVDSAASLALAAIPGQTVAPANFYGTISHSVTLVEGATYYAVAVLDAVDASEGQTVRITLEEECLAEYKS